MDSNEQIKHLLLQQLESLRASGVQTIPKGPGKIVIPDRMASPVSEDSPSPARKAGSGMTRVAPATLPLENRKASEIAQPPAEKLGNLSSYGASVAAADRANALGVIQEEVSRCRACEELCDSRKQTVFGVGDPNARLCFVGEGPGADEDRQGEPFVGAAGQLLNKIIGACKLGREDVYILNTVKCRPPGNRNPQEQELEDCWPYAIRQLEIIQPEFICCLGSVAARTVLGTKSSISKLRGQFHQFRGSRVVVTYHPAYLLRTPAAKKHTWNDMKMLMAEMGIQL